MLLLMYVIDLGFNSTMVRKQTWYDFSSLKSVEICVMASAWSILVTAASWKACEFCAAG